MAVTNKGCIITGVQLGVLIQGGPVTMTFGILVWPDNILASVVLSGAQAIMGVLNYLQSIGVTDVVNGTRGCPSLVAYDDVSKTYTFVSLQKLN